MIRRVLASAVLLGLLAAQLSSGLQAGQQPAGAPGGGARAQGPAAGGARGQGPLAVPPGGFFFVQLSDTQFGFSNNDLDFIQDTVNAEFAVATVNRLKPAFVVVTGDLVNKPGDAAQIAEYRRIIGRIDKSIPVYNIAGNHDIENEPTPATIAAYRKIFGPDYFTFQYESLFGIVLNSTIIHSPVNAPAALAEQEAWLGPTLEKAKASGAKHVVVFQHHPWFLEKADEADQYFNIPMARRTPLLDLFRRHGIRYLISGHLHRSTEAVDAGVHSIVTGPVGRPLAGQSGFRVFVVTDAEITSRYFGLGEMPYRIGAATARGRGAAGDGARGGGRGGGAVTPAQ
jgi:hypothetical protein